MNYSNPRLFPLLICNLTTVFIAAMFVTAPVAATFAAEPVRLTKDGTNNATPISAQTESR